MMSATYASRPGYGEAGRVNKAAAGRGCMGVAARARLDGASAAIGAPDATATSTILWPGRSRCWAAHVAARAECSEPS